MRLRPQPSVHPSVLGTPRGDCGLREGKSFYDGRSWLASPGQRSLGLRASRSQSPRRLTDKTIRTRTIDGKRTTHQIPENRYSLPILIRVPRDGCVGGMPTPKNERVASVRMAIPKLIVAMTR